MVRCAGSMRQGRPTAVAGCVARRNCCAGVGPCPVPEAKGESQMPRHTSLVLFVLLTIGTPARATEHHTRDAATEPPAALGQTMDTPLEAVLAAFARSPRELDTLRFVYYQLTVKFLAELMYLPDPLGAVDFADLSPAIAAYQSASGEEPTGELLFGQYDQLLHRALYVQRRNMSPIAIRQVDIAARQPGPVSLKGAWREEGAVSEANATVIRCRHAEQRCSEAHARLGHLGLDNSLRDWRVVEWTAVRLLAVSGDDPCLAQSLVVNLRNGRSELMQTPASDDPACAVAGATTRRYQLVSSYELFSEVADDPLHEYLNPAATHRLAGTAR